MEKVKINIMCYEKEYILIDLNLEPQEYTCWNKKNKLCLARIRLENTSKTSQNKFNLQTTSEACYTCGTLSTKEIKLKCCSGCQLMAY